MGGRGGSSGFKPEGFSYIDRRGKSVQVVKLKGTALVNGQPNMQLNNHSYSKLKSGAKKQKGFKELSAADVKAIQDKRNNRKSVDYELGAGVPFGNKQNREAARLSRLQSRTPRRRK